MSLKEQIDNKNIPIVLEITGQEPVVFNLLDELSFTAFNLQETILSHTELVGYITYVLESHREYCDLLEQDIRVLESSKWVQHKSDTGSDSKAMSDVRVTHLVNTDINLNELKKQALLKKSNIRKLEQVLKLFNTKKELMQTFSSNARMNI